MEVYPYLVGAGSMWGNYRVMRSLIWYVWYGYTYQLMIYVFLNLICVICQGVVKGVDADAHVMCMWMHMHMNM